MWWKYLETVCERDKEKYVIFCGTQQLDDVRVFFTVQTEVRGQALRDPRH